MADRFTLAAVQFAPVYMNRQASLEKAICLIGEAGKTGACLAGFGEAWLPGYPFFAFSESSVARWEAAQGYIDQAVIVPGRLCCANAMKDSPCETSLLVRLYEQTEAPHLPHLELARLQRSAGEARIVVDLVRSRDAMAGRADREARASARVHRRGDPGLPDAEGALWVAASANDRDGGKPA